jgi:hypothetical protein
MLIGEFEIEIDNPVEFRQDLLDDRDIQQALLVMDSKGFSNVDENDDFLQRPIGKMQFEDFEERVEVLQERFAVF